MLKEFERYLGRAILVNLISIVSKKSSSEEQSLFYILKVTQPLIDETSLEVL